MNYEPKIDDVDVIILKTLLKEPRASFSEMAKDCGLSVTAVRNRFNSMKESGIITGTMIQINPKSVGYDSVGMVRIETDPRYKKKVRELLIKNPHMACYGYNISGKSNIVGFVIAKNADDLSRLIDQIKGITGIRSSFTSIWVDVRNMDYPQNLIIRTTDELLSQDYLLPKKENRINALTAKHVQVDHNENVKTSKESQELDNIDISIIKILSKNARVSFRRIANKLSISTSNVISRYKKIRKTVLPFSSITLNLKKLGYVGTGVMRITVSNDCSLKETFDRITQIPNVIVAIKLLADYDILAVAPFRILKDLTNLTEEISNVSGVYALDMQIDGPYTSWPINSVSDLIIEQFSIN